MAGVGYWLVQVDQLDGDGRPWRRFYRTFDRRHWSRTEAFDWAGRGFNLAHTRISIVGKRTPLPNRPTRIMNPL